MVSEAPVAGDDGTALQVLRRLESGPRGLTEAEAAARLADTGGAPPPATRPASWPRLLLRGTQDPFTAVLLVLGLVSALVASWGTAAVILALVAVSVVLRAHGEHRADRSLAELRELVAGTATVLRRPADGQPPRPRELPVADLVPGDVIRLGPGDLVPADVRLLRARGLTVHQAALTGESAPVAKSAERTPGGDAESHLCFQGSDVASGSATAVVLATGARTRIAATLDGPGRREASAFDRSVHGISWVLIRFMLLTPPLVLMANAALRGRGLETLPFAVAVAVGLTPEMLPVIVTTCLARGAALLARTHGVIVKRLPALHDLGAIDVLCVDKTGTLTQDRPVVDGSLGPDGHADPVPLRWAAVNAWWTLHLAELPAPDALDEALLEATADPTAYEGPDAAPLDPEAYDGVDAVPHDPVRRLSTAVVRGPRPGTHTLVVKGAVEDVLDRCSLEDGERARLEALARREADGGLRLLAVATAQRPARTRPYTPADERGLTYRGLVTFRDPLVPEAAETLRGLTARGVTVRVLTGDHPGTAARICRELGWEPDRILIGAEAAPASGSDRALAPDPGSDLALDRGSDLTGASGSGLALDRGSDLTGASGSGLAHDPELTGASGSGLAHDPELTGASGSGLAHDPELTGASGSGLAHDPDLTRAFGSDLAPAPGFTLALAPACRPGPGSHFAPAPGSHPAADPGSGSGSAPAPAPVPPTLTVHARCTPADKARVVEGLRAAGYTVGFLGDGVNDAPALRAADVGIAPRSACAVARECADVVLGEKDLGAVGHTITAGRYSGGNIASYLRVTLSSNLGNVLAMLTAGLLLPFLPMLPAQVLVQNLCFDAAQLAFAYDRPGAAALRRPAELRPRAFLRFLTGFGALNAIADLATFGVLALALHGPDAVDDAAVFHSAWFTENLLTQALVMVLLRTGRGGAATGPVGRAAAVLGAVGLLLPPSPLGARLGMTPLPLPYYLLLVVVLGLYALALRRSARRRP
ncbi:HAD-IC family P-type ATPase [Streptomyces sp. NBC_00582]|uniref:HAD-IC family P-type ATPase n=1 Tax=Streptomyces sp. NBC_00582 TaxID=2975783 RepID=UPI002E8220D4|nr:HAD-IC family P-type ATPase [Streptomyces sp. NBC_00582]WUB61220.1 HAD-IC family P-type ATPase [Streptomyces sp. NBC_00582]